MRKLLMIFAAVFLFVGCSDDHSGAHPKSVPVPIVAMDKVQLMNRTDLRVELTLRGMQLEDLGIMSDDMYAIPDKKWFVENMPKLSRQVKERWNALTPTPMVTFQPDDKDCDDHARNTSSEVRMYYLTARTTPGASLAVGDYYYKTWTGVNHVINFALVRVAEGKFEIMWYDPQEEKFVNLYREEKAQCQYFVM
jgi:hypothetical protein